MGRTIKGRLTISVICIVVISIVATTAGIIIVAGKRLIQNQTDALQLNADKYAEEINTWIENEKMLAGGAVNSIEAAGDTSDSFLQSVMDISVIDVIDILLRSFHRHLEPGHHKTHQLVPDNGILCAFCFGSLTVQFRFGRFGLPQLFHKSLFLLLGFFSSALRPCLTSHFYRVFHRIHNLLHSRYHFCAHLHSPTFCRTVRLLLDDVTCKLYRLTPFFSKGDKGLFL